MRANTRERSRPIKAVQFTNSIPRYLLTRALRPLFPQVCWGPMACLQYREVPEPPLPGPDWARVKVRLGGICGSDLGLVLLRESPYLSSFTSFPFTLGHENVGELVEIGPDVHGFSVGERVVVEPILPCAPRGFDVPCLACQRGEPNLCTRTTEGRIAPGILVGACRDTGGSWSHYLVAHRSQLLHVPDRVSDENALMAEPFASALHPVVRHMPADKDLVLVLGSGVIGLGVIAGLRALGSECRIIALAKHPRQAELARSYGADRVVLLRPRAGHYQELAEALDARVYPAVLGKPAVAGGADVVFECVGRGESLDDALRFTREGGKLVLVGLAGQHREVDWTPVWYKEVTIQGSNTYGVEKWQGRRIRTLELALELMAEGRVDLAPLVTHRFPLHQYGQALATALGRGHSGAIKVVFDLDKE